MREPTLLLSAILLFCGLPGSSLRSQGINKDLLVSPRLATLKTELEAGNRAALEHFWQEVTKQGTPLVEPIKGESRYVWLTFLWRAKEETKNVVIWSDLGNWQNLATLQMARLADTDLWYKTYRNANHSHQLNARPLNVK